MHSSSRPLCLLQKKSKTIFVFAALEQNYGNLFRVKYKHTTDWLFRKRTLDAHCFMYTTQTEVSQQQQQQQLRVSQRACVCVCCVKNTSDDNYEDDGWISYTRIHLAVTTHKERILLRLLSILFERYCCTSFYMLAMDGLVSQCSCKKNALLKIHWFSFLRL